LVVYNATPVCGKRALEEEKLGLAHDDYEDEHFKRVDDGQTPDQYSANNMA